jgi:hypothetical protein
MGPPLTRRFSYRWVGRSEVWLGPLGREGVYKGISLTLSTPTHRLTIVASWLSGKTPSKDSLTAGAVDLKKEKASRPHKALRDIRSHTSVGACAVVECRTLVPWS